MPGIGGHFRTLAGFRADGLLSSGCRFLQEMCSLFQRHGRLAAKRPVPLGTFIGAAMVGVDPSPRPELLVRNGTTPVMMPAPCSSLLAAPAPAAP